MVNACHLGRFDGPVVWVVLHDAQSVYPDIPDFQLGRDEQAVSYRLGHTASLECLSSIDHVTSCG
jgi:hypothetical protein